MAPGQRTPACAAIGSGRRLGVTKATAMDRGRDPSEQVGDLLPKWIGSVIPD
jgi:hypothetical protein